MWLKDSVEFAKIMKDFGETSASAHYGQTNARDAGAFEYAGVIEVKNHFLFLLEVERCPSHVELLWGGRRQYCFTQQ